MHVAKFYFHKFCPPRLHPANLARKEFIDITKNTVISGPFLGMKYIQTSVCSVYPAKLMGTYELELHPLIEELCQKEFSTIINVGAAEGYYSIGMARRCPNASIIAFETDVEGQQLISQMAQLNAVRDRVLIQGHCSVAQLEEILSLNANCLLIVDVEGEEIALLDPVLSPNLTNCYILVELHEHIHPGLIKQLHLRFNTTHQIQWIQQRHRTFNDLPVKSLLNRWFLAMITENRLTLDPVTKDVKPLQMSWFYMAPYTQVNN